MATKTEAAEFADIWGEALHSARWFRGVTILLSAVVVILLIIVWVQAARPVPEPLVVRVDAVGRAEVVDYDVDRATVDQGDPVVPYFLTTFVTDHYSRRHGLGAERWQLSHYFLTDLISLEAYERDQEELVLFISSEGQAPEQVIENLRVRIIPQPEPPYRAEVFFDRVGRYFDTEVSRSTMSLSIQFVFADRVPSETILVNPLGIVVTYLNVQEDTVGATTGD